VYVTVFGRRVVYGQIMQLRYRYRLYPTSVQRAALVRAFGCARVVFNDALAARRDAHRTGLGFLSDAQLSARLTASKKTPERAWLAEVSAVVLQQALADLCAAYRNFLASTAGQRKGPKFGAPQFRSRKDRIQAIRFTRNARFKITAGRKLRLPGIGEVAVRWSRPLPSEPSSVTVIKDAAGRFFASFVVETDTATDAARFPGSGAELGIDLGLAHFAVLSDGRKITSPRFLRRAEKKLKHAQRAMSRKQEHSANREKARANLARAHAKAADARLDFHHKLSTALIRETQAVAVEDLAVKGLARTRLAKSVHDAGWAAFLGMLEYKARRYGRAFTRIGRFEPTSQVCSTCGARDGPKPLHVRTWSCPACGTIHDRDINAAKNILALGRRERLNACRDGVRPPREVATVSEAGTRRSAA